MIALAVLLMHLPFPDMAKTLCDMLTVQDSIVVEGLEMRVGEGDASSNEGVNQVAALIEDAYGNMLHENIKKPTP